MKAKTTLCVMVAAGLIQVGCSTPDTTPKRYTITLIRPDGVVHFERVVESTQKPRTVLLAGGVVSVVGHGYAPVGWLYEIDGPLVEGGDR